MPATKQGGGHTLTFSKKNRDVRDILETYKKDAKETGKSFIANDYICEAIRFYEENKDNENDKNGYSDRYIERVVEEKIKELMKSTTNTEVLEKRVRLEDQLNKEDIEED